MMKTLSGLTALLFVSATILVAQGPPRRGREERRRGADELVAASVRRMLEFDADKDGHLSRAEVADARLASLFDRGDANHDGILTQDELTALFKQEAAGPRNDAPAFGGSPEDPGRPGGGAPPPGGPGLGPLGGFPRPGEVLPRPLQDELHLSQQQREDLEKLQADVDLRLAKILTAEQRGRLARIRPRGFSGPGNPGDPRSPQPRRDD